MVNVRCSQHVYDVWYDGRASGAALLWRVRSALSSLMTKCISMVRTSTLIKCLVSCVSLPLFSCTHSYHFFLQFHIVLWLIAALRHRDITVGILWLVLLLLLLPLLLLGFFFGMNTFLLESRSNDMCESQPYCSCWFTFLFYLSMWVRVCVRRRGRGLGHIDTIDTMMWYNSLQ